jgi:hypothetical protein
VTNVNREDCCEYDFSQPLVDIPIIKNVYVCHLSSASICQHLSEILVLIPKLFYSTQT